MGRTGDRRATEGRVLVVAPQPFYEDRGTPIATRHLLQALARLGYRTDVLTFPVGRSIEIPGVRYFRVPDPLGIRAVPIGFSLRKLWLDLLLVFPLIRRLSREEYVCVHALEEGAFIAALIAPRFGVPVIYDMQSSIPEQLSAHPFFGTGPVQRTLRACERWMVRRAAQTVSSVGLADRIRAESPGARIREWRYPADGARPDPDRVCRLRRRLGIGPRDPVVLYTGTFEDYQGLDDLLAAIPRVLPSAPATVFVLVGADPEARARVSRRLNGGMPDRALRILDRQPRERISDFLAMADIVVSPRRHGNNLPLKILGYLASGRAIVATSIPAHRAVLNEAIACLARPSADGLAEAISGLLACPERIEGLQTAAREYADRHLGWPGFVEMVRNLYDDARVHG